MASLVLQPVDRAAETALAQQITCWARTARGVTDPLVRYTSCCASPTGQTSGRWTVDAALCSVYGPLPFTGNDGETIDCSATGSGFTAYLIYASDVTAIDPNTCTTTGDLTAQVFWEPDPEVMTAVVASATVGSAISVFSHQVMIDFGDGTQPVHAMAGAPVAHDYQVPGQYTITAWPVHHPGGRGQAPVTIKPTAPTVHMYADPYDDWRAQCWVDEAANGSVFDIDWGDGTPVERIRRDPPPYPRVPHQYTAEGHYTVTVTDTGTKRWTQAVFTAGSMGMLFSFPSDAATPFVLVRRMRVGSTWEMDWGDGSAMQPGRIEADGELRTGRATPMDPGTYTVTAREIVDGLMRRTAVRELTIPSQFALGMVVDIGWQRSPRVVSVIPQNARNTCTVSWGDGSADDTVEPGSAVQHTYAMPMPEQGRLLTVTEIDTDPPLDPAPRTFTRLLGEPVSVGVPQLSAYSNMAVDLHVAGIDGLTNADWYRINWGDGTISDFGAVGAWWPAWHQYGSPGIYTIVVDGPGMAEPAVRQVRVVDYPSPTLTAVEDENDPDRMTVQATVNNTACGGPVELRWGDRTDPVELPETGSAAHTYTEAGTYLIVAICKADPTARVRTPVTVPFAGGTLQVQVRQHGADPYTAEVFLDAWEPAKTVLVDWDDGTPETPMNPPEAHHTYDFDRDYTIVVRYSDDSESVSNTITIPFGA